jgi:hypothetical protein
MKKKKRRLREKIKNRPKTRNRSKKRSSPAAGPPADAFEPAVPNAPDQGLPAMSQVILDFARPLLETCSDEASERKAISLAIFVWNTTLLPDPERKQTLEAYLETYRDTIPKEDFEMLCNYIDRLVQDKNTRFADNRNKITNCTFGEFGDSRRIEVGYTLT